MDFELASKHKREIDQRRKEAKRKLEQQKRDEEVRSAMEKEYRERELVRLREEQEESQRAQKEAAMNDGIRYLTRLKPYPSKRTDDKLELPASALEELERQGALDRGTLLTFAVSLPAAARVAADGSAGSTHAGVAEFTAEPGTVGVPPRVALCLTKGAGLDSLASMREIEVRFVRLPRSAKSRVLFQPRGEGFHTASRAVVNMDLEHVLQESLRGHTALTEGDWLPIRHDGYTYELVVKELQPETSLALLDTDLTVEVLPSEQTEAEAKAEERRKELEEAAVREAEDRERRRLERAALKAASLAAEPAVGPDVVQLRLRCPEGGQLQRRFARSEPLGQVLDWVESEPTTLVAPGDFRVVQKWPGHVREFGPAEAAQTLAALGFGRQEALFLQRVGEVVAPEPLAEADAATAAASSAAAPAAVALPPMTGGAWSAAQDSAHEALDRRLDGEGTPTAAAAQEPELQALKGQELVEVFHRLVALGMPQPKAAIAAKNYAAQLKELGQMGFENWIDACELLERYNGRLLRVANLLSERAFEGEGGFEAPPAAAPAAPPAAAAAPPAPAPAAAAAAPPQEAPAAQGPADVQAKLVELATMGFVDEERNRALIQKYAGRMERVVEALCSG